MCHLLLVLPIAALPLFWLFPFAHAVVLYGAAVALSAVVYFLAVRALRQPVQNGRAALVGDTGTIVAVRGNDAVVQMHGELWDAVCREGVPAPRTEVTVNGCGGTMLLVSASRPEARDGTNCPAAAQSKHRCASLPAFLSRHVPRRRGAS